MRSFRVVFLSSFVLCALVFSSPAAYAQATNTGTIVGQVKDPSGAAIAGATVTITDLATRISRGTTTNTEGRYILVDVTPSVYDVTITQQGFRAAKLSKQTVQVGTQLTLNATLQVGVTTEIIEITAANADLQTLNATVGSTVSGLAIDALPSISRDVATFAILQPGVSPNGSTAGAVYDQNTFQLDGGQNSNDMDGSMNIYTPSFAGDPSGVNSGGGPTGVMPTPIDSIEEFKANTTGQTADFNSSAGSQISMVTRRGTDTWHGTAYEYYLDNNFDANTWQNNHLGVPLADYHYSRFGAAGGGPLIPKKILGGKTYFFANYEGWRFPNVASGFERIVPGPGMDLGLLSFNGVVYNLNPYAVTYPAGAPSLSCPTSDHGACTGNPAFTPGAVYQPGANNVAGTATIANCNGFAAAFVSPCDPRGLGISPVVHSVFSAMPQSNFVDCSGALSRCDNVNVLGYNANVAIPENSDFAVARLDHDFGPKWHFFSSFRYYHLTLASDVQTDFSSTGQLTALGSRPQVPWFFVTGLTTNITNNLTNDFHYSYLRNFWSWLSAGDPAQGSAQAPGGATSCPNVTQNGATFTAPCTGLGAAIEPFGESPTLSLTPYNVNTQQTRTRYWNGHDNMLRDDISLLKGNHLFQWGGSYEHNWDAHQRTDNGGGINYYPVYQLGITSGPGSVNFTGFLPTGLPSNTNWERDYSAIMGITTITQQAYTRSGSNLKLNAALTPAMDESIIPYYNLYFTDSWKLTPTVTLSYGLAWTLELPPYEVEGRQIELVNQENQLINIEDYLKTRKQEALQGVAFDPEIGFTLVRNAAGGLKYPYNPYYGSFSPRLGMAWNPNYDSGLLGKIFGHGKSVVRGGFSILYGRLNGVDLVLVPLLGTGLIQAVQCTTALMNGTCGAAAGTPATAFRIGPTASGWDGVVAPIPAASPTLPQPDFPGFNAVAAGAGEALDPNFRPNKSYTMDFTLQRQITSRISVEAGYIGRVIEHEYLPINMNAVPYMFTEGGQSFAKAYAAVEEEYCGGGPGLVAGLAGGGCLKDTAAVTPQPFFESLNTFGGPASGYCTAFASCTAAVVANEGSRLAVQDVWRLWSDLDPKYLFGPTMLNTPIKGSPFGAQGQTSSGVAVNASVGYGNYNAFFLTFKTSDWHGVTAQSNFTWGKSLGTDATAQATSELTPDDPFFLGRGYTLQPWDRQFLYNLFVVYSPHYYASQHGVLGHVLGGWSFAPIFVAGSGLPLEINTLSSESQSFGEGDSANFFSNETAVPLTSTTPFPTGSASRHNNGSAIPFAFPQATVTNFRDPILGLDTGSNSEVLRGQPFWNIDFNIRKNTAITERVSVEAQFTFANVFNHVQLANPSVDLTNPTAWGELGSQLNTPRQLEMGIRLRF